MKRIFQYTITPDHAGMKIYDFLKSHEYSKAVLTHVRKTEGGILLNNAPAFSSARLCENDHLTITLVDETSSEQIVPIPLPIHILYEDDDLLVLDKAANQPIHPSINNYENTLANGLAWYFAQKDESFVYRCINRLDRDTTGLLIVAKNMLSAAILSEMGKRRELHREYLAIAQGEVPEEGIIEAPIARADTSVIARCVDFEHGETAVTHFKRLCFRMISLLSL